VEKTNGNATREQTDLVERFIAALETLEQQRDVEPLADLYAAEAEVGNVVTPHEFTGPDGARDFWTRYREAFGEVRSSFRNIIVAEGRAALEWTSEGTNADGTPFTYGGVSILEMDGDAITRFRAYFNPSDLGRQIAPASTATA
jgi:ketosteroid isomerase-like protein